MTVQGKRAFETYEGILPLRLKKNYPRVEICECPISYLSGDILKMGNKGATQLFYHTLGSKKPPQEVPINIPVSKEASLFLYGEKVILKGTSSFIIWDFALPEPASKSARLD